MIEGYLLFCIVTALYAFFMIHMPGMRIVKAYIDERKMIASHWGARWLMSGIFFLIVLVVLAPLMIIPILINPKDATYSYAKSIISTIHE